jgi:hypothetical protein
MRKNWFVVTSVAIALSMAAPQAWAQNLLQNSGWIGISTTAPGSELDVNGRIRMSQNSNFSEFFTGNSGGMMGLHLGSRSNMPLAFYTNSSGPQFVLTTGGSVGIGTISPGAMLHVVGNVQVDGNIAAKYQDVAEWVPAATQMAPGTVVILGGTKPNEVSTSEKAYDTRVAGVVSDKPGLILGEGGENQVKVAHIGRVKVKVYASYGPVQIGDLLVTSATPGHAMRSQPVMIGNATLHQPGTLIGKALEPLDNGQGEVLVLLTLQ